MDIAELLQRTKQFALRVLKLGDHLPSSATGRVIGNRLILSGTSIGANYRAACRSRSRADFAAKMGVVAEKADESVYWLELIDEGSLPPTRKIAPLLHETNELTAIFTASRRTSAIKPQTSKIKHA